MALSQTSGQLVIIGGAEDKEGTARSCGVRSTPGARLNCRHDSCDRVEGSRKPI